MSGFHTVTEKGGPGSSIHRGADDQTTSAQDDQLTLKDGEVVINEDSDSLDFRVESNGNDHMLLVDGSADRVGIGIMTPPQFFSASPVQYETGTASQSGTTVTGSGTTWTDAHIGAEFIYADGTSSGAITARGSNTSITVTTSQTVSSQAYKIHYPGLQVESTGHVGIGTLGSDPDSLLHVWAPNASTAAIHIETDNESSADPRIWFQVKGNTNYGVGIDNDDGDSFKITQGSEGALGGYPRIIVQKDTGNVGIGTTSPGALFDVNDRVQVTNDGVIKWGTAADYGSLTYDTGEAIVTSQTDQRLTLRSHGDSTDRLTIATSGNVGIGTTDPDSLLEVAKDSADAEVLVSAYHDTEATTPKVTFRKADGSEASPALVDDNAVLGTIDFLGHDGVNFERGAKIEARVQGTSASNDLPTELTFWTTPDGSNTAAERVSIGADGAMAFKEQSAAPSATANYCKIVALEDGVDANTVLLLHCDGDDDGTTFTDSGTTGHTVTANGNVHTDTTIKKFGTASFQSAGATGDFLSVPDHADWNFAAGDFTIECYVRHTSLSGNQGLFGQEHGGDPEEGWYIEKHNAGIVDDGYIFRWRNTDGDRVGYEWSETELDIVQDAWYHFALVRYGTRLTLYIDGQEQQIRVTEVPIGETTLRDADGVLNIGMDSNDLELKGYMDEIRISKGVARYTDNFTPPGAAFPITRLYAINSAGDKTLLG